MEFNIQVVTNGVFDFGGLGLCPDLRLFTSF